MPSWCQSEASVIAPHLTDNVVSGERRVRGRLCVRVRALAGSDHKDSLVSAHCGSRCDCRSRCVLASDPGPLLSHSQPARTALAVWRPEEPLPPLRMRPGSSLSLTWRCVGLLRVRAQLWGGGRTIRWIIGLQIRCDNYHHLHHLLHLHLLPWDSLVHPEHRQHVPRLHYYCPIMSVTALMRSGG